MAAQLPMAGMAAIDPKVINVVGIVMRQAVKGSDLAELPEVERADVIAAGVAKLMAAGAFVHDGALCFPASADDQFST